jgi:hypothetical protein
MRTLLWTCGRAPLHVSIGALSASSTSEITAEWFASHRSAIVTLHHPELTSERTFSHLWNGLRGVLEGLVALSLERPCVLFLLPLGRRAGRASCVVAAREHRRRRACCVGQRLSAIWVSWFGADAVTGKSAKEPTLQNASSCRHGYHGRRAWRAIFR